ncbi:MAG: hypothetical protein ACKO24_09825 [Leptolyngbyaceae cyanobacterium]
MKKTLDGKVDHEWGDRAEAPVKFNHFSPQALWPKGRGCPDIRKGYPLEPLIFGGGHQGGLKSGTLNVPGRSIYWFRLLINDFCSSKLYHPDFARMDSPNKAAKTAPTTDQIGW